jgi:hypothetical protein
MAHMNKIIESIIFVFITTIASSISFASTYDIAINANHSSLEARFDVSKTINQGSLTAGISAVHDDDDYKIVSGRVTLGSEVLTPGLRCALGFKGVWGEIEDRHKEGDLLAIPFLLSATYDIPETISGIPLEVSASICAAPDSLCFEDSERYVDVRTTIGVHILENAAILVGYRHLKVHFDDSRDWKKSDDALFVGYKLRF